MEIFTKVLLVLAFVFLTSYDVEARRKKTSSSSTTSTVTKVNRKSKVTLNKMAKQLKMKDMQIKNLFRRLKAVEERTMELAEENKTLAESQKILLTWKEESPWRQLKMLEDLTKEIKAEQVNLYQGKISIGINIIKIDLVFTWDPISKSPFLTCKCKASHGPLNS